MRSFWYPGGYQILLAAISSTVVDVGVPGLAQQQVLAGQH